MATNIKPEFYKRWENKKMSTGKVSKIREYAEKRMKDIIYILGRWILTGMIIYLAYAETGKWTTVCLISIFIYIELNILTRMIKRKSNS